MLSYFSSLAFRTGLPSVKTESSDFLEACKDVFRGFSISEERDSLYFWQLGS